MAPDPIEPFRIRSDGSAQYGISRSCSNPEHIGFVPYREFDDANEHMTVIRYLLIDHGVPEGVAVDGAGQSASREGVSADWSAPGAVSIFSIDRSA